MAKRRHVVAGKTQCVIKTTQRKLDVIAALAFQLSKGLKAALAGLAVTGDRKVQFTGQIPQRIILRLVQPFAVRASRDCVPTPLPTLYSAPRFLDHLTYIGARQ